MRGDNFSAADHTDQRSLNFHRLFIKYGLLPPFLDTDMKDAIIEVIDGSEPVDALQALFAVVYAVAAENGIERFTLNELFSSTVDAHFQVADAAEELVVIDEQTEE